MSLSALPGWAEEDHLAAFRAYVAGCVAAREAAAVTVCERARTLASESLSPSGARRLPRNQFRGDRSPDR